MYTQCPYCSTSFRVTAEVLKQAAGKVRCGGCGNAFNALAHLSEEKPVPETPTPASESHLPELKPEPLDTDAPPAAPSETMSPEQSAALLKTLDQLAGNDVHLEDTGIEWRVMDGNDERDADMEAAPAATLLDKDLSADLEARRVDEVLTSTDTPVDEVLDAGDTAGAAIDSPEVFEEAAGKTVPDDELRFDDNTGLPEDEDYLDDAVAATPAVPEPTRDAPESMANLQVDLGFGDPDEWQDLLEETGSIIAPETPPDSEPTLADELEALDIELESEGNADAEVPIVVEETGEPPADSDQLATQMEALSLELSGIQEELDMLTGQTGEQSIIEELEALELVEDNAAAETEAAPEEEETEESLADDAALLEAAAKAAEEEADELLLEEEEEDVSLELIAEVESLEEESLEDETWDDATEEVAEAAPEIADDEEDRAAETSIDDDLIAAAFEAEASIVDVGHVGNSDDSGEHEVPPLSEEEQTLNMLIDQDLMALAVEDEDGFASTMVIAESTGDGDESKESSDVAALAGLDIPELPVDAPVESIVMEGATARSGENLEEKAAEEAALKEEAAALIAAASAAEEDAKPPINWGLVAGLIALVILLALQVVHFSRDALARAPAVNDILAPVYRAVGVPLTPAWDITGWDFEATRGSTDETGEVLSIFSRIGNNSESALPYPVISVSLTDRFEETIGSRVFEPSEYLADDLDPERKVAPGTTFNALMLIESPADAATGFKLNVCYRLADRDLKCAIKDFR